MAFGELKSVHSPDRPALLTTNGFCLGTRGVTGRRAAQLQGERRARGRAVLICLGPIEGQPSQLQGRRVLICLCTSIYFTLASFSSVARFEHGVGTFGQAEPALSLEVVRVLKF